ncbi:Elongator subunit elp2, partial [Kappamyces sp. JEL0680]
IAAFTAAGNDSSRFHNGDLMVATASQDKYIRIWKISPSVDQAQSSAPLDEFEAQMKEAMDMLEGTQLSTKAHFIKMEGLCYSVMLDAILLGHDDWVFSVNWEPARTIDSNGKPTLHQPMSLVSASADKTILIWAPDKHSESWVPTGRVGEVGGTTLGFYGGVFSSSGKVLFSNGYGGAIHIWSRDELGDWNPEIGVSGHLESVEGLAWDPTGAFLLSTSQDQTSRIFAQWKSHDGTWHEIARSQIHGYNLHCCAFIDKYTYVSGADEKVVRIFEAPKTFARALEAIAGVKESKDVLAARPAGASLPALGLSNKAVLDGEAPDASLDSRLSAYTAGTVAASLVSSLSQPPFEEHLLQNTLWPEKDKLYGHGYEIMTVAASPDGTLVASACKATKPEHAAVRLWLTSRWAMACEPLLFHSLTVTCMAFSHSSRYLLTAGRDRGWALFDLSGLASEQRCVLKQSAAKAHARIVWDCAFSFDDFFFITGSRDKTIKLWAVEQLDLDYELIDTIKVEDSVTALDIFPRKVDDCYVVAIGFENGGISIIHLSMGFATKTAQVKRTVTLPAHDTHSKAVKSLGWRPATDDLQLASCSEDGSVRLFTI